MALTPPTPTPEQTPPESAASAANGSPRPLIFVAHVGGKAQAEKREGEALALPVELNAGDCVVVVAGGGGEQPPMAGEGPGLVQQTEGREHFGAGSAAVQPQGHRWGRRVITLKRPVERRHWAAMSIWLNQSSCTH